MTDAERQAQRARIENVLEQIEGRYGVRESTPQWWLDFVAEHPELDAHVALCAACESPSVVFFKGMLCQKCAPYFNAEGEPRE